MYLIKCEIFFQDVGNIDNEKQVDYHDNDDDLISSSFILQTYKTQREWFSFMDHNK